LCGRDRDWRENQCSTEKRCEKSAFHIVSFL
jgi:hypothetical protein